jgi:hypothetical protein
MEKKLVKKRAFSHGDNQALFFNINIRSPLDYNQIRIGTIEFESQKTKNI